ncbi:MAG: biopolymer transporter ExbD, partial [Synergistaceae bacterium]|nr:biopolymer transporter ExbD [Synergistaceae bacterium]
MTRRRRRGIDLDITPLIDVLFMLIIFFVLTATFLSGQIVVDLPQGEGVREGTGGSLLL